MTDNKLRYSLTLLLILVLLVLAAPVLGTGAGQADLYIIYEQSTAPGDKINPEVREASVGEDYIEVLVKMTRQVNTGQVAHNTLQYAPPGNRRRVTVRAAVVEKLRTNAATGQENIKQYLEQEQRNGNVLEYYGYYIVNMIFVKATPAVVEQLSHRTDVKVILPNSVIWMEPPEIVGYGDIMFQNEEWGVSRVNAPFVWEQGFRGEGAVVGIIDSGVAWEHEALRTKWRGYNSAEPGSPNVDYNWYDATVHGSVLPKDASGHGTHVTGTVLGSTGSNQIGVAPDARWIAARIFDDNGKSTVDKIIRAGEFMLAPTDARGQNPRADLAPDIINNSWGSKDPGDVSEWFRDMVRAWRSAQILPVFAAGNSGEYGAGGISNPANYPECLAVAAIDSDNKLAHFSSRGPGFLPGIKPEISAPGVGIRSSTPGGSYKIDSGTSMAAPHVAGVAALLLSANPGLDVDDLEQIIINTAVPLTDSVYSLSPNYGFGYGLVDALAAVNRVCGGFVTGQVLARGIDNESPVIEHVQEIETTFLEYGFPLEAAVSDNVAVNAVKAMVRTKGAAEWTELSMYLYSGDHLYGDYWGQVPWDLVDEPGLEYKIVAVDFAGLQTETDVFNVEVKFGLMPGWNEDFALEPFMWDWDGDWEWGIPEAGPAPQYGGRVMATNLEGDYSNDLYSFLEMPPLDLRHARSPYLRLDHRYEIEEYYDSAMVLITDDYGENWDLCWWDGDSGGWQTHYIDLNPYKGSANQVYVLFVFDADVSVAYSGWYIDRVSVVEMESAEQNIFYTNFEQDNGGFTVEVLEDKYGLFVDSWEWGSPTSGPGKACSGSKLWATNLRGDYPYWSGSILWSPLINLSSRANAYLEFQHWFAIESNWDYNNEMPYDGAMVVFYTPEDGSMWTVQDPWYYGTKTYWSSDIYDLSFFPAKGYSQLQIGFWFHSDNSINYPGWYIDDVRIFTIEIDVQALGVGAAPIWVPMDVETHKQVRLVITGDKERQELEQESHPVQKDWIADRNIPFRQSLQGPEPAVQSNCESALPLLPVAATITVLETGTDTTTDPANGFYQLWHQATGPDEILTLRVIAPGYQAQEVQFNLSVMETKVLDFILEPLFEITGDLNDDGNVDVSDAIILLRSIVGLVTLTPCQLTAADVNNDGKVDVSDAIAILRYIVGLVPELPIPPASA